MPQLYRRVDAHLAEVVTKRVSICVRVPVSSGAPDRGAD
jgi:hypothetical protein